MTDFRIEKRSAPRYKVLKGATLGLPPSFMLVIEADQFIRRCRPVWRSDKRIGVAFD